MTRRAGEYIEKKCFCALSNRPTKNDLNTSPVTRRLNALLSLNFVNALKIIYQNLMLSSIIACSNIAIETLNN
jgi:hypothetical protein